MKFSLFPVLAAFLCLQQQCQAQQTSSQSDLSVNLLNDVYWITGPQKVRMEDVADINIPDGYRLTDVHGARMILASINDAIPDDLVGILAPAAGRWMAILEYSANGYVKNPDVKQIDTNAVLKQVRAQMDENEKSSIKSVSWQSQPAYDARMHFLEWSLLVTTPSTKVLSRTAALLGRHGVLQITVIQPFSSTTVPSLKQLASNITFKDGERYADYQKGDKVAGIELAELILGGKHAQAAESSSGGSGAIAAWIYGGLVVCLIIGGIYFVRQTNKIHRQQQHEHRHRHRHRHWRDWAPFHPPAIKSEAPTNRAPSNQMALDLKYNESNGHAKAKPMSSYSHGWKPFSHKRRKRSFNHSKFYMKAMSNLTYYSQAQTSAANGNSNGHAGVHNNGTPNTPANGHSNGPVAPNGAPVKQTVRSEIADLMAAQKNIIEEQKRLMEQQARLIAEKSRLIEEQNALLKMEPGLADDQKYPINIEAA